MDVEEWRCAPLEHSRMNNKNICYLISGVGLFDVIRWFSQNIMMTFLFAWQNIWKMKWILARVSTPVLMEKWKGDRKESTGDVANQWFYGGKKNFRKKKRESATLSVKKDRFD